MARARERVDKYVQDSGVIFCYFAYMEIRIRQIDTARWRINAIPVMVGEVFWPAFLASKFGQAWQDYWPALVVFSITVAGILALRGMMSK